MVEYALWEEVIKNVLLDIDQSVRKFHSNVIEAKTGIDDSLNACNLNLDQSIDFFKHVWGNCLQTENQSFDKIGKSIQSPSLKVNLGL